MKFCLLAHACTLVWGFVIIGDGATWQRLRTVYIGLHAVAISYQCATLVLFTAVILYTAFLWNYGFNVWTG